MAGRHGRARNGSPIRDVYVARTVELPQPRFDTFLNKAARNAGMFATFYAIGSTHLTLLESQGVKDRFRLAGYTGADVRSFKGALEMHLKDKGGMQAASPHVARVDQEQPLVWRGFRNDKLALKIVPDDALLAEREDIEEFLEGRFGEVPKTWDFEPHITIASTDPDKLSSQQRKYPRHLIGTDAKIPGSIVLNGLDVYLDRIPEGE